MMSCISNAVFTANQMPIKVGNYTRKILIRIKSIKTNIEIKIHN